MSEREMEGKGVEISLDKLPVKRLDSIEENGVERFPTDIGYDEKRVSLIRRIDFAWAVEKEEDDEKKKNKIKKKQKTSSKETSSATQWPWQSMMENLQLAHQELSVIIDLINTVEANDAVTVASMTRPKLLPNEHLADLAVSTATKLQSYRHLGKYFKQSAKALEQQIAREARFYGALIRLQQNWKVKRQRMAASARSNEGFTFDLFDNLFYDSASLFRSSSLSTIRIDHDSAGMLAINLPPNSCRSLRFGFLGAESDDNVKKSIKSKSSRIADHSSKEGDIESLSDNECVKATHSLLREVHQAIFDEQVFDMVNREAFSQPLGLNVTGIQENYLQLSINPGTSICISLVPSNGDDQVSDSGGHQSSESGLPLDSLDGVNLPEETHDFLKKKSIFPNWITYEIYLQQIFHEHVFIRANRLLSIGARVSGQPSKDGPGVLGHFCMSVAHRIFANKVLMELENVVCKVPYVHLISHPTWHSRTSSWTILMKVPQFTLHANSQPRTSDTKSVKNDIKKEFRSKIVVNDDCISVEAEGAPNVVGLFKGSSDDVCSMNKYDCDLADLPVIILQQVASQVIRWLHEEALSVGMKAKRGFLCLSFELEQGEVLSLVAHVDPEDSEGCISWWMSMEDSFAEERKVRMDIADEASEYRKFLGYLPLDVLYSTLMDLVSLCSGGASH
ncbi:mediator of RNA polymerase II transcription subunit 17 [Mercurialis annua]|uniref:mediator of RNA polymerase II transcription subunit 17 n=1 Tax=Mercurialis annua TaxID=3986 RepID=UPI00216003BF|nr:mediator of RNA polymerase II transcription subunit 17 [Mercurialis annua]